MKPETLKVLYEISIELYKAKGGELPRASFRKCVDEVFEHWGTKIYDGRGVVKLHDKEELEVATLAETPLAKNTINDESETT